MNAEEQFKKVPPTRDNSVEDFLLHQLLVFMKISAKPI